MEGIASPEWGGFKARGDRVRKRLAVIGAAAAVMALAVSMVVGPAGAQDDQRRTIRVTGVTIQDTFADLGEQGFSLGDKFIFSAGLRRHGERVGRLGVECTITMTRHGGESQCVATARFGNGQITAQGLLAGEPETFVFPVTGGSGAYLGAEGTVRVRQVTDTREILTFRLED
jgi:hypothetical protein